MWRRTRGATFLCGRGGPSHIYVAPASSVRLRTFAKTFRKHPRMQQQSSPRAGVPLAPLLTELRRALEGEAAMRIRVCVWVLALMSLGRRQRRSAVGRRDDRIAERLRRRCQRRRAAGRDRDRDQPGAAGRADHGQQRGRQPTGCRACRPASTRSSTSWAASARSSAKGSTSASASPRRSTSS